MITWTMARLWDLYEDEIICHAPTTYLPVNWTGTVIDGLSEQTVHPFNRFYVAIYGRFLPMPVISRFMVDALLEANAHLPAFIAEESITVLEWWSNLVNQDPWVLPIDIPEELQSTVKVIQTKLPQLSLFSSEYLASQIFETAVTTNTHRAILYTGDALVSLRASPTSIYKVSNRIDCWQLLCTRLIRYLEDWEATNVTFA